MTSNRGISDAALEAIELRLLGADDRPWGYTQSGRAVGKASRKDTLRATQAAAIKGAGDQPVMDYAEPRLHQKTLEGRLYLFRLADGVPDEMGEFVAHAPEDIMVLLREVKAQRDIIEGLYEEKAALVADLKASRAAEKDLREKLEAIRKPWIALHQAMEVKP